MGGRKSVDSIMSPPLSTSCVVSDDMETWSDISRCRRRGESVRSYLAQPSVCSCRDGASPLRLDIGEIDNVGGGGGGGVRSGCKTLSKGWWLDLIREVDRRGEREQVKMNLPSDPDEGEKARDCTLHGLLHVLAERASSSCQRKQSRSNGGGGERQELGQEQHA
jgi:hypothetical protein